MSARAYILLDIVHGKAEEALRTLRCRPGVVMADALEGRPDIIVLLEAKERLQLADFIMPALASIDEVTEDLRLLVTLDNTIPLSCPASEAKEFR
jgi:hypothetical protein